MSVKVLVSAGYGAGWSTWDWDMRGLATDEGLVQLFEESATDDAKLAYAKAKWPSVYLGGLLNCVVEVVPTGELWRISEYDGLESIEILDLDNWEVA